MLLRIGPLPTHDVFTVVGVAVALLVYRGELRRRGATDPRLWPIAAGGLFAGALFAKLSTAWRYLEQSPDPSLAGLWLQGGKSLLGGLAGAYLGVVVTRRLLGYQRHTGDLFAPAVALGLAIGRIGCFLTEPVGRPTSLPWGITVDPAVAERLPACTACPLGVPMHPSFLYEILFQLAAFAVLWWAAGRIPVEGDLFKLYLLAYGAFRFAVEFTRDTPVMIWGLTGSQVFLLVTVPVLAGYVARQLLRGRYRSARPEPLVAAGGRS